jgi:hypothetical protein
MKRFAAVAVVVASIAVPAASARHIPFESTSEPASVNVVSPKPAKAQPKRLAPARACLPGGFRESFAPGGRMSHIDGVTVKAC